jgi:hypothetical protein
MQIGCSSLALTREQVGQTPIGIAKSATTALLRRPKSVQLPSRSGLIRPRTFWNRGSMLGLLWKLLTLFRDDASQVLIARREKWLVFRGSAGGLRILSTVGFSGERVHVLH